MRHPRRSPQTAPTRPVHVRSGGGPGRAGRRAPCPGSAKSRRASAKPSWSPHSARTTPHGIDDQRVPVAAPRAGRGAELRGRHHVDLVLDRARAQQHVPVILAGLQRERRRHRDRCARPAPRARGRARGSAGRSRCSGPARPTASAPRPTSAPGSTVSDSRNRLPARARRRRRGAASGRSRRSSPRDRAARTCCGCGRRLRLFSGKPPSSSQTPAFERQRRASRSGSGRLAVLGRADRPASSSAIASL